MKGQADYKRVLLGSRRVSQRITDPIFYPVGMGRAESGMEDMDCGGLTEYSLVYAEVGGLLPKYH